MRFIEPEQKVKDYLITIAKESIVYQLVRQGEKQVYLPLLAAEFSQLEAEAATFVTLKTATGNLRGCIGTLQPREALYLSVVHNAEAAAFNDPRFPPLTVAEWPSIQLSISILSAAQMMKVQSEDDLMQQLRPGIDGLILNEQGRSATFLPSVWHQLPDKKDFLQHLKLKAGLAADYWSDSIQFQHYQTFNFSE